MLILSPQTTSFKKVLQWLEILPLSWVYTLKSLRYFFTNWLAFALWYGLISICIVGNKTEKMVAYMFNKEAEDKKSHGEKSHGSNIQSSLFMNQFIWHCPGVGMWHVGHLWHCFCLLLWSHGQIFLSANKNSIFLVSISLWLYNSSYSVTLNVI